ncbi:thioredoxin family protein [Pseudooceanicola sp.]|uniref:DUF1223 domain-containing protein n=1 Tax=Pseudooceanicola sp. TaxID=1914328 RepID=UPI002607ECB3|nr:DUF1223 domain-containing protein [Pseudooceanicola sp.]MDF1854861.1 DUF1223 domain-containing protein [Pseudooceanicola sp.]
MTWVGSAVVAQAQDNPVVVELYTSQGCSSCPPADAFLGRLAPRNDIIALALHVDYWDYIGWKDIFADPKYTQRQKSYARFAGRRSVYTPQMVIHGQDDVVGTHPMDVSELVMKHAKTAARVKLAIARLHPGKVEIKANALSPIGEALVVQLIRYRPSTKVQILSGENAGQTLTYANVVTEWHQIADWDSRQPLSLTADAAGDAPVVVLVQRKGPGAIEAAARLR